MADATLTEAAAAAGGALQAGSLHKPMAGAGASDQAATHAAEDLTNDPAKLREELQKCQKHVVELSERWEYAMRVSMDATGT
jgi:hypothetical protein